MKSVFFTLCITHWKFVTVLFSIGKQFQAAHEKYFADDKVEVLKTYSTILMDMATTFAEIGMGLTR